MENRIWLDFVSFTGNLFKLWKMWKISGNRKKKWEAKESGFNFNEQAKSIIHLFQFQLQHQKPEQIFVTALQF